MRILKLIVCGLVLAVLCGCRQVAPPASLAREAESVIPAGAIVSADDDAPRDLPGGLRIEPHRLVAMPEVEPLTFKPVEGTQEEILAVHELTRGHQGLRYVDNGSVFIEGQHRMSYGLSGTPFSAIQISHNPTETIATEPWGKREVQVLRGDEPIYAIQAGDSSPYNSFQGLWFYDGHWVLEIAHVIQRRSPDSNAVSSEIKGQLVEDGVLLNDQYDYDEAFGFQLIAERPFYFFKRDGSIGISYAGRETDLGYTGIHHYRCCSGSESNPMQSETMVAFFAQRDAVWYYVEIGAF